MQYREEKVSGTADERVSKAERIQNKNKDKASRVPRPWTQNMPCDCHDNTSFCNGNASTALTSSNSWL